ncbi:MAG: hypothetical protein GY851_19315, partial [bacterium]|nr:hypothetical protein [bacterium]
LPENSLRRTYHKVLVARILEGQDTETWHPIGAVADAVQRLDYNVLFLDEHWRAIQSHAKSVNLTWKTQNWRSHEQRLFCWMVQSMFAKLGVVQVSEDQKAFRLTPLGQYVLGVGPAPEEAASGAVTEHANGNAVVVQPDFEVVAYLDRCSLDLRRKLDLFCQRANGGIVRTYRLTQETVYRGVRSGMSASVFLDLLECSSERPIPENVREQFATWQRKLESVVLRTNCHVLEFQNAKQARQFLSGQPEARLVGDRFVLAREAPPEVSARIDYTKPRGACLQQEPGLGLRAAWEDVHLFLKRRLDTVCEVASDKHLDVVVRLTPEGVKNGVDWGLIVADLESLVTGPLAPRYRTALKAWSGDLAPAQSATATLVRFDDPEACEAALELADVAGCVEGRLGLFTVVVRRGRL